MEKSCLGWQGHPPTRPTLGEPFHTFPYKTWRTVYMCDDKRLKSWLARLEGSPAPADPTFLHKLTRVNISDKDEKP